MLADQSDLDLRMVRKAAEHHAIITTLDCANDNIVKAAEILRVSRLTLYDLVKRQAIKQPR